MDNPQGPQGGPWLPPPDYGQPYQQPRRSAIPKVVGILMIVFASLGLLVSLIALAMSGQFDKMDVGDVGIGKLKTYHMIEQCSYLLIGILHMVAGIMCVMHKRAAPMLAVVYAVLKILVVVVIWALVFTWLAPVLDKAPKEMKAQFTMQMIVGGVINISWPIVAWVLMSRPSARAACDR